MNDNLVEKLKVLIVTENLNVGGAEKYTVLVANELHSRGHRVVVLANEGPFREHFHPGIRFVRAFFERGILGVLYGVFQIIRISIQESIHFIHAQKLESSKAAWLARFITGVPIIKTAHGYTRKELKKLGGKIDKYSNKVVTVVDWLLPELRENGVEAKKLSVIYNGTSSSAERVSERTKARIKKELGIKEGDKIVVSMARLERGKNYISLVNWFKLILKKVLNAKLIIIGGGPDKENLVNETKKLGIEASIIFIEPTTATTKYLQIADVFVTPSVGRGMAVLEAMAEGLPVVGIKPEGNPRVIVSGRTGYVVGKGNGGKFAEKTAKLLLDFKLARRLGLSGRKRVREKFTIAAMVDQLEAVYQQVI